MEHQMINHLQLFVFITSILAVLGLVARQIEKKWPIDPDLSHSDILADWKAVGITLVLSALVEPFSAVCAVAIVNAAGGGFIHLRTDGWWYAVSLIGFVLVADLYRYGMHRLSHAVPVLWAMHSFHHSAEALTFVTGARHYWLERAIEGAFFPVLAILFKVPPDMVAVVGFIYFLPDGCAHLNVRFPLGRAITWLNSPQWHRIHHSTQPEHFNRNFASLLPLWDILFGTAWIPHGNEYPATGLVPGEKVGIVDSIIWPFRHYPRRPQWSFWKAPKIVSQTNHI
jgi:sterol desaturase/sphingolipid hydroxylase (fatty acid hydroxylase superfamily)